MPEGLGPAFEFTGLAQSSGKAFLPAYARKALHVAVILYSVAMAGGSTLSVPLYFETLRGTSLETCVTSFRGSITQEALKLSGRGRSKSPGFRDFTLIIHFLKLEGVEPRRSEHSTDVESATDPIPRVCMSRACILQVRHAPISVRVRLFSNDPPAWSRWSAAKGC
jgi:hypothetical protein